MSGAIRCTSRPGTFKALLTSLPGAVPAWPGDALGRREPGLRISSLLLCDGGLGVVAARLT